MNAEKITAKAQAIKEATDKIIDNIPDTWYPGFGAVNWADVRCDNVYWLPASDEYLVKVNGANSALLAAYLRDALYRQSYETEVITGW